VHLRLQLAVAPAPVVLSLVPAAGPLADVIARARNAAARVQGRPGLAPAPLRIVDTGAQTPRPAVSMVVPIVWGTGLNKVAGGVAAVCTVPCA
jgi:hypothetical protein